MANSLLARKVGSASLVQIPAWGKLTFLVLVDNQSRRKTILKTGWVRVINSAMKKRSCNGECCDGVISIQRPQDIRNISVFNSWLHQTVKNQ